ncbi:MAG TPA: MBOAT family O-acyltransferase [Clostridia bacterium]|nr:MBOAT family O-acyltransferase [Clostridia bacterium]
MVFSGLFFLTIFLPVSLILYYAVKNRTYRNVILTIMSLVFYAWGEPVWILLLLFCSMFVYLFAIMIERSNRDNLSKTLLIVSIAILIAILGFFKYSGFIVDNISSLFSIENSYTDMALPLGLSFYTFTCISYLVDVYKKKAPAQRNYVNMLMYISLFFTVTSGPIQRYPDLLADINANRESWSKFNYGVHRFIIGLAKKAIIANTAGSLISSFMGNDYTKLSVQGAWIGILLFSLQIYFDFSGYSDMAIGLASMFGFSLKENFNYPYISRSATEFWRRWHISLGSFFRDYVYIPLGGNRKFKLRNLFIVWFLTGLWHGASWNFVIWGLYFFVFLLIEKTFLQKIFDKIPKIFSHIYFVLVMLIGWVFFYNTDLIQAIRYIGVMFNINAVSFSDPILTILFNNNVLFIIGAVICAVPLGKLLKQVFEKLENKISNGRTDIVNSVIIPLINIALLAVSIIFLVGDTYTPFLYFNF